MNRKQWFIDRIGKRVYRVKSLCDCEGCRTAYENGVIITDESHANYLYDCEREWGLIYYDTLEEVKTQ